MAFAVNIYSTSTQENSSIGTLEYETIYSITQEEQTSSINVAFNIYNGKAELQTPYLIVVLYDENSKLAKLETAEPSVLGKPEIIINGETKALDVAPIIREGRTFLPLRACTEAIGKEVFYSKGLILISDTPDILDGTWDADVVDLLIENYFLKK